MKKIFGIIILAALVWGCSGKVNTSLMNAEEHFGYAMSLYEEEDYEAAVKEFESVALQYPGSTVNDDAQYYLAMTYFKREEYLLSAYEFSKLIRDIPASEYVNQSQYMLAESYYNLSPNFQLDQSYSKKAIDEYQAFIDFFPLDDRVPQAESKIDELNKKLAHKEYFNAFIYQRMDYKKAAIKYYEMVANQYHDTEYAPKALYNKIKLLLDRDEKNEALKDISRFLNRYPDNSYAPELAKMQDQMAGL